MATRMDKYNSDSVKTVQSRSKKNEHLYEKLYTNKVYTEFTDITTNNMFPFDTLSQENKHGLRENYQNNKILNVNNENMLSQTLTDCTIDIRNNLENKDYDINTALANARKNRNSEEEKKQKRYLKTVEYSILSDLTHDKLKENNDKNQKLTLEEENNLEELINTITSNSLRKKIDNELLSDLLPNEDSETIISKQLLDQLEDEQIKNNLQINNINIDDNDDENKIDDSFYTKSMDLSEEDFEQDEEDKSFLDSTNNTVFSKILIIFLILLVLSLIVYVVYRFI